MGNRLYVGNLSYDTTRETLETAFGAVGQVDDVAIPIDRDSGRVRGFAFVTMGTSDEAQASITQLHGTVLDGREIKVNEARERPGGGRH